MSAHYLRPEFETDEVLQRKPIPGVDPPEGHLGTWTPSPPYFFVIQSNPTDDLENLEPQ